MDKSIGLSNNTKHTGLAKRLVLEEERALNDNKKLKPCRVVFVVSTFPVISEAFILNQIKFLIDSGYEVEILAAGGIDRNIQRHSIVEDYGLLDKTTSIFWADYMPKNYLKRLFKSAVTLYQYRDTQLFVPLLQSLNFFKYRRRAISLVKFYQILMSRFLLRDEFEIVHVHFANNMIQLCPLLERLNRKLNLVVTFHGYDAFLFSKRDYASLVKRTEFKYTVNTRFLKRQVESLRFNSAQINVLPVGLDTNSFLPKCSKKEALNVFRVIFVGRLIPLKAPLLAIKIVHLLHNEKGNVYLSVIGEGPEYKECREYIRQHGLEDVIELKGNLTQEDVKQELSYGDAFLFPGIIDEDRRAEAQGLVIQEAQAMELPVIVSDAGGMKDGLIDGKTGYVVPEKNISAFVSKLSYLQDNPIKKREMGEEARRFVVENYDNEVLGQKLLAIYAS